MSISRNDDTFNDHGLTVPDVSMTRKSISEANAARRRKEKDSEANTSRDAPVKLKSYGLTDADLLFLTQNIPNFRGVFMVDEVGRQLKMDGTPGKRVRKPGKNECGIVNYQDSSQQGNHWVAYFVSEYMDYNCYFDSVGAPPPEEIDKFLKRGRKEVVYNGRRLQEEDNTCGLFTVAFLHACVKAVDEAEKVPGRRKPVANIQSVYYDLFEIEEEGTYDEMVKVLLDGYDFGQPALQDGETVISREVAKGDTSHGYRLADYDPDQPAGDDWYTDAVNRSGGGRRRKK